MHLSSNVADALLSCGKHICAWHTIIYGLVVLIVQLPLVELQVRRVGVRAGKRARRVSRAY
jgi:hypothetical protein